MNRSFRSAHGRSSNWPRWNEPGWSDRFCTNPTCQSCPPRLTLPCQKERTAALHDGSSGCRKLSRQKHRSTCIGAPADEAGNDSGTFVKIWWRKLGVAENKSRAGNTPAGSSVKSWLRFKSRKSFFAPPCQTKGMALLGLPPNFNTPRTTGPAAGAGSWANRTIRRSMGTSRNMNW